MTENIRYSWSEVPASAMLNAWKKIWPEYLTDIVTAENVNNMNDKIINLAHTTITIF